MPFFRIDQGRKPRDKASCWLRRAFFVYRKSSSARDLRARLSISRWHKAPFRNRLRSPHASASRRNQGQSDTLVEFGAVDPQSTNTNLIRLDESVRGSRKFARLHLRTIARALA